MKETKGLLKKQEKVRAGAYLAIIVLLCAASWLSICGCDRQSEPIGDGNQSKTDFQNSWYAQGSHRIFTESEEHYYFIAYTGGQAFLYFADKEAMEPHPLCKREGCLHEEEPDFDKRKQCDAFIDEGAQYACINFADGYLYLLSALGNSSCLVRIDEKTGERTALYWLDRTTGSNAAVHRGYLYTAVTTKSNVNYNISQIWRHSLEKKESELLCEIPTAASSSNELKAFKESLYIRGINLDELNQTVYYRLDLDTGEQEMLKPLTANRSRSGLLPGQHFVRRSPHRRPGEVE